VSVYRGRRETSVAMNIKNASTEELTRRLAALTGESMTTAITVAVRERLERLKAGAAEASVEDRAARVLSLGREIAPRLTGPFADADHGDLLYDDRGLPT
jgi:antitoxin VapB